MRSGTGWAGRLVRLWCVGWALRTGVVVVEGDWAGVLADISWVLFPEWGDHEQLVSPVDGDSVQVRDTLTGQRVLFWAEDKGIEVRVTVPDDAIAAARLRSVLEAQRTTSFAMGRDSESGQLVPLEQPLWRPVEAYDDRAAADGRPAEVRAREWWTGWRHGADYRDEVAASVVAVLRDGLLTTPANLRLSAYGDLGPRRPPKVGAAISDRPTGRGLPARCSGWDEFADRLEWVLTTLPGLGYLNLSIPGRLLFVQLSRSDDDAVRGVASIGTQADARALHTPMRELGWIWGAPYGFEGNAEFEGWITPPVRTGTTNPTMARLVALIVGTLRTIGEAEHPNELAFEAFSNRAGADDMSYVATELGIAPA
ncbi:hypothetical protein [Nocardia sp. NPDC056000]|uniref:TY-Chap domain-containing protein n=1 Tax=Nocardia sp. NPDC056000 TaxID=3345674 RepID=UPI0035E24085